MSERRADAKGFDSVRESCRERERSRTPLVDRRSDAPIGQTVSRLVVANRPLHEAPIEPPFWPSGSSVDCANGGRRFSRRSASSRAIRRPELFLRIFFFRHQAQDLRQVHAPRDLTT